MNTIVIWSAVNGVCGCGHGGPHAVYTLSKSFKYPTVQGMLIESLVTSISQLTGTMNVMYRLGAVMWRGQRLGRLALAEVGEKGVAEADWPPCRNS